MYTTRSKAGALAMAALVLTGCSSGSEPSRQASTPEQAKELLLKAVAEADERSEGTYQIINRETVPDGGVRLGGCTTTSFAKSRELVETTSFLPPTVAIAMAESECQEDWRRQRLVLDGDTVALTETFDDSSSRLPTPSRGWRECRSIGELAARGTAAGASADRNDPLVGLTDQLAAAGPVERSSDGRRTRLKVSLTPPDQGETPVTVTMEFVLGSRDELEEIVYVQPAVGDRTSTTRVLRVVDTLPVRKPAEGEIEQRVEVATLEELHRCLDPSPPAGGS